MHGEAVARLQNAEEVRGERPVVDVGAGDHPRRGDDLLRIPTLHDKWNPFAEPLPVFRVLHAPIAMMRRERGMSLLQEGDVLGTLHEAHVRDGVDEGFWRPNRARPDEVGPELPREIELDVDLE